MVWVAQICCHRENLQDFATLHFVGSHNGNGLWKTDWAWMLSYKQGLLYGVFLSHLWTSWPGTFYRAKLLRTGEMSSTATGFRQEGLTEAFRKFSRSSKIGVFRPHSPVSYLPYSPLCPQWLFARKTVFPTKKLKGASQKGKVSDFTNS